MLYAHVLQYILYIADSCHFVHLLRFCQIVAFAVPIRQCFSAPMFYICKFIRPTGSRNTLNNYRNKTKWKKPDKSAIHSILTYYSGGWGECPVGRLLLLINASVYRPLSASGRQEITCGIEISDVTRSASVCGCETRAGSAAVVQNWSE